MAQDPYKYFRIEAHEIVGDLGKGLLELEKHADAASIAKLLRLAHTLKGAARIVRHRELADLSHAMEDVLAPLRDAPVARRVDGAFAIVDRMTSHLAALSAPVATPEAARGEDAPPLPRVDASAVDDALGSMATVHALVGRLRAMSDPHAVARQVDQIDRELREVRRDVEHLRLSSAGLAFTALERTARDAAVGAGKRVRFVGNGAEVRVDGHVLATLHGALVQLVRNAVAHGIETPTDRVNAGKPAEGRVTIAVRSLGRRISVTCEDDGRGLDLDAIRRAAKRRGVLQQDATERDPTQLFQLLLQGGITTSREVTELAGRGIGLDVVRDAAHGLGGEVTVKMLAGGGTAITLVVPVSLTASTVLHVECGDRVAAIPQAVIKRVSRLHADQLVHGSGGTSIAYDDLMVPYASLAALLGGDHAIASSVVFVDSGEGLAAIGVDRVLGFDDTVVRAVPPGTPIDAIVWGVTLDAEGQPVPVVEPRALVAATRGVRPKLAVASPRRMAPILVVDDSLTTRMLEQSILESAGFDVEVAASAEEALEKLAHGTFALVLADVEMPGMDGFSLIAELRSRPALAELPAILVTSRDAPADRRRGVAVGAQGYVVKSQFDQVDLLAMIRRLVRA